MEYVMFPQIRYTQFPNIIHEQRCALDARLRAVSHMHVIHKVGFGAGLFRGGRMLPASRATQGRHPKSGC